MGASLLVALATSPVLAEEPPPSADGKRLEQYYRELRKAGIVRSETSSLEVLRREIDRAETLLHEGSEEQAAVALFAIVESPRFADFHDFVEYQNAEFYLGVSLMRSGALDGAIQFLLRSVERGPSSSYFAPAHRRLVDIALDTGRYAQILNLLSGVKSNEPIPPGAAGELAYLRARQAYSTKQWPQAEGHLAQVSPKSRLYSSALYLRGVIRAQRGDLTGAGDAFCEIAATPDQDRFSFVIDQRYFRIKDLARAGLGRIAHEAKNYDDAYYHYFQIPEDSIQLSEALFEAAWSMYEKRELGTARDLTREFLTNFPESPLTPEAQLLAGYIELADCKFDEAQKHYDQVAKDLTPVVAELARIKRQPQEIRALFDTAISRWRQKKADEGASALSANRPSINRQVLSLLRLDPDYVALHQAVTGLRSEISKSTQTISAWTALAARHRNTEVRSGSSEATNEGPPVELLLDDLRNLQDDIGRAQSELRQGVRDRLLSSDTAHEESESLRELRKEVNELYAIASHAADVGSRDQTSAKASTAADNSLPQLLAFDKDAAQGLAAEARKLLHELETQAAEAAKHTIDNLYRDTRRVLDKANLGKIDAVIGQKRKLQIEVEDLASGRFPEELHGQLWEQGLIGDDEEFWPFQGEYWADEYEGWR